MRIIVTLIFLILSTICFSQSRAKGIGGYWKIGKLAIDSPATAPGMKALRYNTTTKEVTLADTTSGGSSSLTSTFIGYGSGTNTLTGTSDFIRNSSGEVILNNTDQGAYKFQVAGNMYLGNSTQSITATPEILNMGGTIGNALAGSKIWLYNDGFNKAGIGFNSSGTTELSFNTSSAAYYYRWYGNGTQMLSMQPSTKTMFLGDGTTGAITQPYYLSWGDTYTTADITNLKIKLRTDGAGSDYGFGVGGTATKLVYVVPGTNTMHSFFTNATERFVINNTSVRALNSMYIGSITTAPTALLHITAGTATASTAPVKFTAGTILTTPESGVLETNSGNELYYSTSTTGPTRGFVALDRYDSTATGLTLGANNSTLGVTATGQTITLPTAAGKQGRIYTIKLTASGSCTIATTSSQLIDGATTYSLASQYKYVTVQSTGANWVVIANN